jgi:hypothetical protein
MKNIYDLQTYLNMWNHATAPYILRTDHEHKRNRQLARAIENRMRKAHFIEGIHWKEFSNGSRWAIRN